MNDRPGGGSSGPPIIVWTPFGRDDSLAKDVLTRAGLLSYSCHDVEEVCQAVSDPDAGLAIVAEEALNSASISYLRQALQSQPSWSNLPLILLTGGGNSTEASLTRALEMRALGNITLLERPLRRVTLVAAVESGLASRRRQFQTRDYIQQLQEVQDELAHANEDLKQFAFAASHDLQEPLRMVNIFTQLLLERHVDQLNPEAKRFAEYVRIGVNRMSILLRDVLLYSKTIHEKSVWPTAPFQLDLALSDSIQSLKLEIETSQARVISRPMPVVNGDPTQLSLVFQNLLSNSIKYAAPSVTPVIEISAHEENEEHLIRVRDNGIGFDQAYAERVFDLFQRLGPREVPGTGLGLAICRRIVARHGGRIWAESAPGKGSTFFFTLPRREVEHASPLPDSANQN